MDRILKFRLWDKSINKMIYPSEIKENSFETYYMDLKNGEVKLYQNCYDGGFFNEDVDMMQFTGLYDKNGKEIYEGDIILTQPLRDRPFSQKAKSKRLRGIVKYNIGCGKNFINDPDKIRYWAAEWDIEIIDKKEHQKYNNYGWGLFFECEVIGNIYDNKNLLEEG